MTDRFTTGDAAPARISRRQALLLSVGAGALLTGCEEIAQPDTTDVEKLAAELEAKRAARAQAEAERRAALQASAKERAEQQAAEAERIARERAEAERLATQRAEAEREAAERAEAERLATEKAEAERLAAEKAEAERLAAEKAEAERLAAEKAEAERLAAEKAEAERIAAEKAEAERIAAEKAEAERIAAEKAEAERIAAEKAEAERIAAEKAEAERIAAEKAEAERIAAEKAEAERLAAEKAEAERIAREKAEAEQKRIEEATRVPYDPDRTFPLIIDTATKLTPRTAQQIAALGVQTVFRYYGYEPPSIRDKHLDPRERDVIFAAGMNVATVFQHHNHCHLTFANKWGKDDAERALVMARENAQPEGSAIYFGIDGDWPYQELLVPIKEYLTDVAEVFEGSGYDVGVYGGGCILNFAREEGLAKYFWLSGATGFSGTQAYFNSGNWTLYQNQFDVRVKGSVGIDTNVANQSTNGYFGQWGPNGVDATRHDAATTAKLLATRRFVTRNADVRSAPGGARLARLRRNHNVLAIGPDKSGWTQILTQEGGDSARARHRVGFIETNRLTSFDSFADRGAGYGLCGSTRRAPASFKTVNCGRAGFRRR